MPKINFSITTGRIEAFSDGFIAVIITIMVFDVKFAETALFTNSATTANALTGILPRVVSYLLSFLVLSIIWINHHQLFQQLKKGDAKLLWFNMFLLFWISFIPFVTSFIGTHPDLPLASVLYGGVFFFQGVAFTILRNHITSDNCEMQDHISIAAKKKGHYKYLLGLGLYFMAIIGAMISIYISFAIFAIVPALFFIPEKAGNNEQIE